MDSWLTVGHIARGLGVSPTTVRLMEAAGKLAARSTRGLPLFREAEVERLAEDQEVLTHRTGHSKAGNEIGTRHAQGALSLSCTGR